MTDKRVQFNTIVQNQLPAYVREEFPLISEFLKQYYLSQEFQGAPTDLIQNIDQYIRLNETTNLVDSVILKSNISFVDTTIEVDLGFSPTGTNGFPDSYGLIKIDDEIILYTSKTSTANSASFNGCIRGFSGISSLNDQTATGELVFSTSSAEEHIGTEYNSDGSIKQKGSTILNLSNLFLKQFLLKTKYQLLPGLEDRELFSDLNEDLFIKQSKDFYGSKGTDESFKILFKSLYDEEVKIIKPKDFLLTPSNAQYTITNDLVVESISGDPLELKNSTLYQNSYLDNFTKSYAPITSVEKISSRDGKTFYKLSVDAGYNRDIVVDGATYGNFLVHPKTKVIGEVSPNSTILDVDSTVGFPTSGQLFASYNDGTAGVISYTSKSLTQFYGCSNIVKSINNAENVGLNTYASNSDGSIKVRINSVISGLDVRSDTRYLSPKESIQIKTLGVSAKDFISKNWYYNISSRYEVQGSPVLIDTSDKTYRLTLKTPHYLKIGDSISIVDSNNASKSSTVVDINSEYSITIRDQGELSLSTNYTIKRNILKPISNTFSNLSSYTSNVQNVYKDSGKTLLASNSIPSYYRQPLNVIDRSITFSGTFIGDEFVISNKDHGFYTGDVVYYTPQKVTTTSFSDDGIEIQQTSIQSSLFDEGLYFIKRVNETAVKFAKSKFDIYYSELYKDDSSKSKYVKLTESKSVSDNKIEIYKFNSKTVLPQKILREIQDPISDGKTYPTSPGFNGILVNGVEILNYKSSDVIYHGKINSIDILSPGLDYDVINPPELKISDRIGTGATGYVSVNGSLREIQIIDPGFDYVDVPTVKITGGNGSGALASVNMKLIDYYASFNSDSASNQIGIGVTVSTIGFSTYHKFRDGETVIYDPKYQQSVGGITTNSTYFVSVKDSNTVKLHKTFDDAVSGINTITLTSYGSGIHYLKSYNKKSVVGSINVVSGGSNYQNKKRTTDITGISTSLNQVTITNHDYQSGEIVKYATEGASIGGLISGSEYYLTKIDDNNFKLSNIGIGVTEKDFFYRTNQYIDFTSVGVGTHTFNYPNISVTLSGKIGISSIGSETFEAQIQPVFRGEITSVHLKNSGVGYGSSDIINIVKEPEVSLVSGQDAQLLPVISNGRISEVLVLSTGRNYNSVPILTIVGDGVGAVVTPIIENNSLKSVKVIEPGQGYSSKNTSILVSFPGSGCSFKSNIQTWRVNLFERNFNTFTSDDGFIESSINDEYELQYCNIYAPRKLRESLFSVDSLGKTLYGTKDLSKNNAGVEEFNAIKQKHSPIIGWAYDGHPIYGPYGYSKKFGGVITQMKSGYKMNSSRVSGPPTSIYPLGFFVEDYTYFKTNDETVLDENNGRFCITPEYPKGTYAYFATINNLSSDSSGPFYQYRRPVFPYLIGNNFKSIPNKFNYDKNSNQDSYDLNKTSWIRNTDPYNLRNGNVNYEYLSLPNNLNQTLEVKSVSPGSVESIKISSGGLNYKVNDEIIFDNSNTNGFGASAKISKIFGKSVNNISVATSSVTGVEIYPENKIGSYTIFSQNPHNFKNGDLVQVSGLSTSTFKINNSYPAGISTNTLTLVGLGSTSIGIKTTGVTGIVTYINVLGNLNYPNIRENDILTINSEKIKVLNVDAKLSRIRIIREIESTVGSAHTVGSKIYENPRKLIVNTEFSTTYNYKLNKEIYFNPIESVGLGTTSGVGIGTTIFFSNPGIGLTEIFIPTKTIYLPGHNLNTGDQLTYSTNDGKGLSVLIDSSSGVSTLTDQQILYVAKVSDDLIGISTVRVGLGTTGTFVGIASTQRNSTTLFFSGIGTGIYHSFKTNYDKLSGKITKNIVTVSTAQTHGLQNGDTVYIDVNPSISTTVTLKYNDYHRKVLINAKTFISSGVNTSTSLITIDNHGFETGDKVIHTSPSPAQGLENNKIYYVVKFDDNSFKLSNTYYNSLSSNPSIVGIASTSNGEISLINPPLNAYKNSSIIFDLSDSSLSYIKQSTNYPAFDLNFYLDENFTQLYDKNPESSTFEVQKSSGVVGVSTDAKVTLFVNEYTPKNLFYKLDPLFDSDIPIEKQEINVDSSVLSNNKINVEKSVYSGKYTISAGSTIFTYSLNKLPENNSYVSTSSSITYQTDSLSVTGAISEVEITNKGRNYYSLPGISSIVSTSGSGSILEPFSNSIGKIKNTTIKNIGFDFSSDYTVKPSSSLPQLLKIDPLASFSSIGISSFGRGYTSAPNILVFDGKTNQIITDVDLRYNLGDSQVTIFKNTYGINNVTPRFIPVQNSNGVGINSISFNSTTKDVTVRLSVGFSTINSFPFEVNDKVLIENISVGVDSTAKGYNSENYDYALFTITSVDQNIGGIGSITYNLSEFLSDGEYPGTYDSINSVGRVIPEKYFPTFSPILQIGDYIEGETVESNSSLGIVEKWDKKSQILKVLSNQDFNNDAIVKGLSSNTQGIASSITSFESYLTLNSLSKVERGWETNSGFLNENLQKIQDSFYYQNFSYSLKSKVDFDSWKDAVGTLNHTLGFKKFSDYQLESSLGQQEQNSMLVESNLSSFEIITDIVEYVDLNCVYDFDLVTENSIELNSKIISDEIVFNSRILTDYMESVGNRVLSIDDISGLFNSNPRSTQYSEVHRFLLSDARSQKYITFVSDKRYTEQSQTSIITLLHDNYISFMNQYGRVETYYDQGFFDFTIEGSEGVLLFYPTNYQVNNYNVTTLSWNLKDNLIGVGSSSFGDTVLINTSSVSVSSGSTTIVGINSSFSSVKVLVEISGNNGEYEFNEISVIHDGTNTHMIDYGQLSNLNYTPFESSGLGTFNSYLSGSQIKIDFTPNVGTATTINTIQVAIANTSSTGIGTFDMKHAKLSSQSVSIASSSSPTANSVANLSNDYDATYFVLQVTDTTNNRLQLSEIMLINNDSEIYLTEFGNIETNSGLGTFGAFRSGTDTVLSFTPIQNIDTQVKTFYTSLRHQDDSKDVVDLINATIETNFGTYFGAETDIKRQFDLKHKNVPIFERSFNGDDTSIVSIDSNTITIPNHFYVTGEKVNYYHAGSGTTQAIGIATTTFVSVGSTDKLASEVYVVKINDDKIKLASSSENALKFVPQTIDITSVGIGTSHRFVSTNQNAKVLLSIDNVIQSPVVSTAVTTTLSKNIFTTDDTIYFSGITSFFGGDLIKIGDEIMRIDGIGIGSTNAISVTRPWLGTVVSGYSTGDLVTKVIGDYNIIDNILNFVTAPYGNTPFGTITNAPDERDWSGISTGSSFHGRVFLRSGEQDTSNETYHKNYIFDDISSKFNGSERNFRLKSNLSDVTDISSENAVILINNVFQGPELSNDYTLSEVAGITTISFTGTATSISSDVNTSNLPSGGIIVSVGSSGGFGYQPLVSAGGTSVVSISGTIQSVSIGNSGSGYRSKSKYEITTKTSQAVGVGSTIVYLENDNSIFNILSLLNSGSNCKIGVGTFIDLTTIVSAGSTFICIGVGSTSNYIIPAETSTAIEIENPQIGIVNVEVVTSSSGIATYTHVGFATIRNGNVSSPVFITKVSSGYTNTNPPNVVFDDPQSYSDIPLIYSSNYASGGGSNATIDIVVGQGSSVIDFEVKNTGYGYGIGNVLTIPVGGLVGIPTTSGFKEFEVTIQNVFSDKFSGWSIGSLQVFDSIDRYFDGRRVSFPLSLSGNITTINSSKGSKISLQDTILIFLNDILQVPGEGYTFNGGSAITFTEAPKEGDQSKIIFYKGSGDGIDVISREIIETVKIGDDLRITYDSSQGQSPTLSEDFRTVYDIKSTDSVKTNPYFGPGNTNNTNLLRPVVWCRQTEDKIINEKVVGKDREIYTPNINPFAYIIKNVGIGSTAIYVDNLKPFFNAQNENDTSLSFQNSIKFISQDTISGAIGTAVVSTAGTISSIVISDGGVGYSTSPTISIGSTNGIGIGTTSTALGTVSISIGGTVTGVAITNPGFGYTTSSPPSVLISSPTLISETNSVSSYSGDSGIVVGFGTTTISTQTQLIFDLYIPQNSYLRDIKYVGTAVTISSLSNNDYFIVYDSNVGSSSTTLTSLDVSNNTIGIGTQFVDNVYEVNSSQIVSTNVSGVGVTYVRRVFVKISENFAYGSGISTSNYFGSYSWGKINLKSRTGINSHSSYTLNGVSGISTSTIVQRSNPLKSKNYDISN
jgi:hypothetical protein